MDTTNPEFFHPDGEMKSRQERDEYRSEQNRARTLASIAAQRAKPEPTDEDRLRGMVEQYRREMKTATPDRKRHLKAVIVQAEAKLEQYESSRKEAKFASDFDRSPTAQMASQTIDRLKRSAKAMYPTITDSQLNELYAIADARHAWPDPDAWAREVWSRMGVIEDQELQRATTEAADKQAAAHKAEMEAAQSAIKATEAAARKAALPEVPNVE